MSGDGGDQEVAVAVQVDPGAGGASRTAAATAERSSPRAASRAACGRRRCSAPASKRR